MSIHNYYFAQKGHLVISFLYKKRAPVKSVSLRELKKPLLFRLDFFIS